MFEWYWTIKTRRYKGHLTLWQYHIYRLYKKYVQHVIVILERERNND